MRKYFNRLFLCSIIVAGITIQNAWAQVGETGPQTTIAVSTAIQGGTVGSAPPGAGNHVMSGVRDSSGLLGNFTLTGGQGSPVSVGTPDVRATGQTINSATLNANVAVALNNGEGIISFSVTGLTASGATITIEGSDDGGATWFSVNGVAPNTGVLFTTLTTDQPFGVRASGRSNVRLRISTTGVGTVTIAYNASSVAGLVGISAPVPGVLPTVSGGLLWFNLQPAASDNHANIINGVHQVYHISATNNSATVNYLRLYNFGAGFNGCNSATNLVFQMIIPANTSGAGFVEDIAMGIAFGTGISICVTSGYALTDVTAATATAMAINIGYK